MNEILVEEINVGQRYRQDYGDLEGLKDSLSRLGSIHPLVLSRSEDGRYDLVAGGRRLRSIKELKIEKLYHGSILDPQRLGFLYEDEIPEDRRKEAELDENLFSLKTKWQEDCLIIADLHELKRKQNDFKWGVVQTAQLLGKGYSKTNVNYAVRIAERLRAGDDDFIGCDNMSDAIALLVKRKEEAALGELQRRTISRFDPAALDTFLDTINLSGKGETKKVDKAVVDLRAVGAVEPGAQVRVAVPLTKMFFNDDFRKAAYQFQDGYFDHVITDIPYGIDMDNLDQYKNIGDVKAEHEIQVNVDMFEPFLQSSYRLTKSGGFCVFFYDMDWHNLLIHLAEDIGWKVQHWPLIAHKTSACRNSTAQYNFTKNYEVAMVMRKDEQTVLRKQQPGSVWSGDFSAERRLYNNQFAKPFELWKWIYSAVTIPGQKVWSPFCGEMSECRAAVNCGLVPFGSEINKNHYLRGLENMKAVYALVHQSNVEFT